MPPAVWDEATREGLEAALEELQTLHASPVCYGQAANLARMPPSVRLAYNLKSLMIEMCAKDPILQPYGLNRAEVELTQELLGGRLTERARNAVLGLLCLPQRERFVDEFSEAFNRSRTRKGSWINRKEGG